MKKKTLKKLKLSKETIAALETAQLIYVGGGATVVTLDCGCTIGYPMCDTVLEA